MSVNIVSLIKIDGQWVNQSDVPDDKLKEILTKVMARAADNIGAKIQKTA